MTRSLALTTAVLFGLALVLPAGAAIVTDAAFTNTAQIQTAANNTRFASLQHVAALNVHYGSWPASGTLNGAGFLDVSITSFTAPPGNTATGVSSATFAPGVTVDYNFSGDGDNRSLSPTIAGPDATTAGRILHDNRYFGIPSLSAHSMTFHGLSPNQPLYVQLLGGQHGWNRNTTVLANGYTQGIWQSNKTTSTGAGLFGFRTKADASGNLTVALQTDQYGGMAAAMVATADPIATSPLPVTAGLNYWLDAGNIDSFGNATLTAGGAVTRWADLALGRDASTLRLNGSDTAPVLVANAINGRPAVRFDNAADRLTSLGSVNWGTVFIVNSVDPGNVDIAGIFGPTNADFGIRRNLSADGQWRGIATHTNSGDFSNGGNFYVNGRYDDAAATSTWHALTSQAAAPVSMNGAQLGGFNNGGYGREFLGSVAEVIVYDRLITPTERVRVQKYLANKYALPMLIDEKLTRTDQIVTDPFGDPGCSQVAVNFHYGTTAGGTFMGIPINNVNMSAMPTGPIALAGVNEAATLRMSYVNFNGSGRAQTASFAGPDASALNAMARDIVYVGSGTDHTQWTLLFGDLIPLNDVYVQLVGGDENWNGDLVVRANGVNVGTWTNVADLNAGTASLMGFFARTDALGQLQLDITGVGGYAGIGGVFITEQVPEPATMALLGLAVTGLGRYIRRRRTG